MLKYVSLRAPLCWPLLASAFLLFGGCSSSERAESIAEAESSQRPSLHMLYTSSSDGLVLHNIQRNSSRSLRPNATHDGPRSVSPSGRYLAFSYTTPDSSALALLDLHQLELLPVHSAEGNWTYSLAWHPEQDRLAFGVYRSTAENTRGPGTIRVATTDGSTRNVGCQAAREVLHWLPDGTLATRNDDSLYLVSADDCATLSAHDARRMYHLNYAPDGERLAFIHRELTYDRENVEYVPDSSLVVSDARLETRETLFGDERRVRHLHWAPDGSELAFDVRATEGEHRQIAIYNGSRTIYLSPPDQTTADQVHPRWSPSGRHIAFTSRTTGQPNAAVRIKGQTRRLAPVEGAVWGWLDDRTVVVPGPDSLRFQTLNGQTRHSQPTPSSLIHVWQVPVS